MTHFKNYRPKMQIWNRAPVALILFFIQKTKNRWMIATLVNLLFVCMDAFPKEGSCYPIKDFASRPGTEQTFLLP